MKIRKYIALAMTVILSTSVAFAQTKVSGTVTDANNKAMIGVTVILRSNTTVGTTTNGTGQYSIDVPQGKQQLIYSFIGYKSDTVMVNGRTNINVILRESSTQIGGVQVVGYGTMRTSDVAGSTVSVKINDTEASQSSSFDQLLQGRAAGVQVTTGNAAPGGAVDIRIRGLSSFNGGGEPLYVVDGVIMNPPTQDTRKSLSQGKDGGGVQDNQNGLMGISPSDIANMEILKDASATAIYGSMGANGVVLITTKKATSDVPTISWNSGVSISTLRKKIDVLGFEEYVKYQYERKYGATDPGALLFDIHNMSLNNVPIFDADGNLTLTPMDWQDYSTRNAVSQFHRFSVAGRNKGTNYFISMGYTDNQGIIRQTSSQQTDARINIDKTLSKTISIGTKTSLAYIKNNMTQGTSAVEGSSTSMIRSMLSYRPFYNFKTPDSNDEDSDPTDIERSPIEWFKDYNDFSREYRFIPSVYLKAKINSWLTYSMTSGADIRNKNRTRWRGRIVTTEFDGLAGESALDAFKFNMDNMLMFNNTFGKDHRLSGTVGSTINYSQSIEQSSEGSRIFENAPQADNLNSAVVQIPQTYYESGSQLASFLGRATYSYKDRYILTATFRADGSSKFTPGNQYSYFPSLGFAWRISEEKSFHLPETITNAKLRLGWGRVGNQALSPYQTLDNYDAVRYPDHYSNSQYIAGLARVNIGNPDLMWETSEQYNIGLDLGLVKNRVNFTIDLYNKNTKDLLQQRALQPSSGFSTMWMNSGIIQNKGLEMAIDVTPVKTKDITWVVSGNISFNRNKIKDIGGDSYFYGQDIGRSNWFKQPANIFIQGQPMGLFWGWQTNGIIQEGELDANGEPMKYPAIMDPKNTQGPGDVRFIDQNGDGIVDMNDRVVIGNPNPKFTYGFNSDLNYKRVTLSLNFNGVYGVDIVNANLMMEEDVQRGQNVRTSAYRDAWRPANEATGYPGNPSNKYPKLTGTWNPVTNFSDRQIEDGSFLRLSNITVNYKFQVDKLKWIKGLNVFVSAKNLLTFTKYSGYDPEVSSFTSNAFKMGVDINSYPNNKTYTFGVSATF